MDLNIPNELKKSAVFEEISAALKKENFTIVNKMKPVMVL
jgi:hypothetical protein